MKRLSGCQEFGPTIGFKSFGDFTETPETSADVSNHDDSPSVSETASS
jgi:hypothetical protein